MGKKASARAGSSTTALSMKSLKITGARLLMTPGRGKQEVLDNVSIEVKDFAPVAVFPFSLSAKIPEGGDISLEGKAGPIDPVDASNTPFTASLKVTGLNLAASGAVPASSGIDGVVSMDGAARSDGHTLDVTARVKADSLKLTPGGTGARDPLVFDVSLSDDLKTHAGQMSRGDIAFGGLKASLTGTWTQEDEGPVLDMILAMPAVPVPALAQLLPSLDIALPSGSTLDGGTATASLKLTGPASAVAVNGSVSFHVILA